MLAEVEKLMDKGGHRTTEQDAALDLMVRVTFVGDRNSGALDDGLRRIADKPGDLARVKLAPSNARQQSSKQTYIR